MECTSAVDEGSGEAGHSWLLLDGRLGRWLEVLPTSNLICQDILQLEYRAHIQKKRGGVIAYLRSVDYYNKEIERTQ